MLAKTYEKYLYSPRPVSKRYPMDVRKRAKQFAPFAALRGLEEVMKKQELIYEPKKILSEERKEELDRKVRLLTCGMKVRATYFKENPEQKSVGQYRTICGVFRFFDPTIHLRIDDTIISIFDLYELSGDSLE